MLRSFTLAVLALGGVLAAGTAAASEFEIRLKAEVGDRHAQTAQTEENPSAKLAGRRPVVQLACDQLIWISWQAKNTGKSHEFPDVLMHLYIVEEGQVGQAAVPKLTDDIPYDSALTMDFKPGDKANWRMSLRIRQAGNYLVRVETIGMVQKHGHEHYAAMDLVVKQPTAGANAKGEP